MAIIMAKIMAKRMAAAAAKQRNIWRQWRRRRQWPYGKKQPAWRLQLCMQRHVAKAYHQQRSAYSRNERLKIRHVVASASGGETNNQKINGGRRAGGGNNVMGK